MEIQLRLNRKFGPRSIPVCCCHLLSSFFFSLLAFVSQIAFYTGETEWGSLLVVVRRYLPF
jgi:hypothetical protein